MYGTNKTRMRANNMANRINTTTLAFGLKKYASYKFSGMLDSSIKIMGVIVCCIPNSQTMIRTDPIPTPCMRTSDDPDDDKPYKISEKAYPKVMVGRKLCNGVKGPSQRIVRRGSDVPLIFSAANISR